MKGRLKYEQVNAIVDGFNAAVEGKYRLLHLARSKKSEGIKKQAQAFKQQETKDTKGMAAHSLSLLGGSSHTMNSGYENPDIYARPVL